MSPARKTADVEEPDRVEGQPHPREVYDLIGQDDALARAARSIRSGRPPHGLMLAGPAGIGKATLAYRIARYVLRYGASAGRPRRSFRSAERSRVAADRGAIAPGPARLEAPARREDRPPEDGGERR